MKKVLIFLAIVIPAVALFYFGLTRDPRVLPSALIHKMAPDFSLVSMEGEKVSLAGLRGKPVLLNFWSTWCGSCAAEHQLIRMAHEMYAPKGIQFYSVLYEDTESNARDFVKQYGKAAPILLDPGLKTAIDYGVSGVPETFFIDVAGRIIYKEAGVLTEDVLMPNLEALVRGGTHP